MAKLELQRDFKELLRLLKSNGVKYLVVGGYAVGYYGYPRATGDLDIWVQVNKSNAEKTARALREFGMPEKETTAELFTRPNQIVRMGIPPVQIEIITKASGVEFSACYSRRKVVDVGGLPVNFISLTDLKANKKSAGRHKDLEDFQQLSEKPRKPKP